MNERLPCEFSLLRYVPDVVKGEFVNIGVVLRDASETARGAAPARVQVRFTRDWTRVRCIDAGADLDLLEALEGEIAGRLESVDPREPKPVLALLADTLSNSIQITEPRAALAESFLAELEQLMRLYVEPMSPPARASRADARRGRSALHASMRTEFERAGVWRLMTRRIAAERYTRRGDPLRLDCGYRPEPGQVAASGNLLKIFHAVSLEGDVELARVLAFTAPQLREGIARIEGIPLALTAVVEPLRTVTLDPEDEAGERYRFGVETMERAAIRVLTMADLARSAETAKRELGLH